MKSDENDSDLDDPVCKALAKQKKSQGGRQFAKKTNIFANVYRQPLSDGIGRDYKVCWCCI